MGDGLTHGEYGWKKDRDLPGPVNNDEDIPMCLGGGPQMSAEEFEHARKEMIEENKRNAPTIKEMRDSKLSQSIKDTNPKDAVGVRKAPISTVSNGVMLELGLAMLEGARKYGRHNYRIKGVRASVYHDAAFRHLTAWWDFGQDIDPDSGLNHIIKAIASLMVLRDAMMVKKWVDDRPPSLPIELLAEFNKKAAAIVDKHPNAKDPFTKESTC